jgi:Icc-related predicted phosphoesterase
MADSKSKRKFHRIFFSTDLHASEVVFRKFLGTAKFYNVDTLVMGGDVTGKTVVPLVSNATGNYHFNFQGQEFNEIQPSQLPEFEKRIMNAGLYTHRSSESEYDSLRSEAGKVSALFDQLMIDRLNTWKELAETTLGPLDVKCYWTGGNDDKQEILDAVPSSEHFVNVDGKLVVLESGHEMISLGWSTPTPWKTPRECNEEQLASKLQPLVDSIKTPSTCIFNVHIPPYDTGLDIAPKLDANFNPPKPVVEGGQQVLIPVGSTAVRSIVEKTQPLLMLCGHIHEVKADVKLNRTMCINPGSEYPAGILRGVIVNLVKDKVLSYQFTSG